MNQLQVWWKKNDEVLTNVLLIVLSVIIAGCVVWFGLMVYRISQQSSWSTLKNEAQTAFAREDFATASQKFKQASKVALDNWGADDPRYIDTLKRLAWVENASGNYKDGRAIFAKVYNLSPEELNSIKMAQVVLSTAVAGGTNQTAAFVLRGEDKMLIRSSETIEKFLGSNDPELVPMLRNLGSIYMEKDKFGEAETQYLKIFSIMRDTEGDTSVGVARAHGLLAQLYFAWGKPKEAEKSKAEAVRIYSEILGPNAKQIEEIKFLKYVAPDATPYDPESLPVPQL